MDHSTNGPASHLAVQEDLSTTNDVSSSIFIREESGQTALPDLELDIPKKANKEEGESVKEENEESDDIDDDVFHPSPLPPKPENDSCKTTVITTTNSTTTQPTLDPLAESYRVIPTKPQSPTSKHFLFLKPTTLKTKTVKNVRYLLHLELVMTSIQISILRNTIFCFDVLSITNCKIQNL